MQKAGPAPRRLPALIIPWACAAAIFAVYLLTLNPALSVRSTGFVAELGRWPGSQATFKPALELLALPLRILPPRYFPEACNVLAALCAALCAASAARCTALLPYDRTRSGRMRGHDMDPWLHIPLAWAPPVLAAGLVGLSLTAWENATSQTAESLDLLFFSLCVQCLCEYRVHLRDRWLWLFAFLVGAGFAANWAMIGFAPLFVVALLWVRGVSAANLGFIGRIAAWFAAGLLLYLVGAFIATTGFAAVLPYIKAEVFNERDILLSTPRARIFLMGLVSVLPFAFIGVKWGREGGSSFEQGVTTAGLVLVELGWCAANIAMAFDPKFSPRLLVYLDPAGGGTPLLTFAWCGAIASAYVAGRLLLLGQVTPSAAWSRPSPAAAAAGKAGMAVALAACVATPAALAWKNWPLVLRENEPWLGRLASDIARTLPAGKPAVVATDDALAALILWGETIQNPQLPRHLVLNVQILNQGDVGYRRQVVAERGAPWPGMKAFGEAESGVGDKFLVAWNAAAEAGEAFYLNPAVNFLVQQTHQFPAGSIFQNRPYAPGVVAAPAPTEEEAARIRSYWEAAAPVVRSAAAAAAGGSASAGWAASWWSRAANCDGAVLQAGGRLPAAAAVFREALAADPDNAAAAVNLEVNAALQAGKPLPHDLAKRLGNATAPTIFNNFGYADEPEFLLSLGRLALETEPPMLRSAGALFLRARTLEPGRPLAWLSYIAVCNSAGEYGMVLDAAAELRRQTALKIPDLVALTRHEANARFRRGEFAELAKVISDARAQAPAETALLLLEADMHRAQNHPELALASVDEWLRLSPNDPQAWLRRGKILLDQRQFAEAEKAVARGRAKNGQNTDLLQLLVEIALQQNQLDKALRAAEDWQSIAPGDLEAGLRRGTILMLKKRFSDAVPIFERLLENHPDDESARANRAISLLELGKLDLARPDYLLLERRNPANFIYQFGLGEIARRKNEKEEALRHFELYLKYAKPGGDEYKNVEAIVRQLKGA